MKILYGIHGSGNGHVTRARVLAKTFKQNPNITVDYIFTGREKSKYFDMEIFEDYQVREGLSFIHKQGEVQKLDTLKSLNFKQFIGDVRSLNVKEYDLVISDFEPITAWAAKIRKIPCLEISHQTAFSHPVPQKGKGGFDKFLLKYFAPATVGLGVHWYHFGHQIMPPIIDDTWFKEAAEKHNGKSNKHFLIYLPFEDTADIEKLLAPLSEHQFEVFHPQITQEDQQDHIHWHRPNTAKFKQALFEAKGVISNGGFELSSECLFLGKKLLIRPMKGQFEQLSNAVTLEHLGLCQYMENLSLEKVKSWIASPAAKPVKFPTDAQVFIDWLLDGDITNTQKICQQLWDQVEFPAEVKQYL